MHCFHKVCLFSVLVMIAVPFGAMATEIMATKEYVDLTTVAKHQGTQGQMLQVNSSGDVALVTPSSTPTNGSTLPITSGAVYDALEGKEDVSNKLNGTSTSGQKIGDLAAGSGAGQDQVMYPSAAAVKEYAVRKPTSVSNGKVLTYTGNDVNSRPEAKYIQVPMATGDPATTGTVSGVASIWLQ